jgi:hypothetical protein
MLHNTAPLSCRIVLPHVFTQMLAPNPQAITASRIPSVQSIRWTLNYGVEKPSRRSDLIEEIRMFLNRYDGNLGMKVEDVCQWHIAKHQELRNQMAVSFLDEKKNSGKYWPSNPEEANYNSLVYQKDRSL